MGSTDNPNVISEVMTALCKDEGDTIYFSMLNPTPETSNYKKEPDMSSLHILSGSIAINYPAQNQSFNPGAIIPANINSSNGISRIIFQTFNYGSDVFGLDTIMANGTINYTVPNNAFGQMELLALGYDSNNNFIDYDTVIVNINQTASLDSIQLYGDTVYVEKNKTASVSTTAYYNNGYSYDVSGFSNVQYQIADTNKAKYFSSNLIQGKDTGMTMLTVNYLSKTKNIPVVIIPEDTTSVVISSVNENQNNNSIANGIENVNIYPNPLNNIATIQYELTETKNVSIKVFDIYGQQVSELFNSKQNEGQHQIFFDGSKLIDGVYIIEIKTDNQIANRKLLLIK